MYLKKSDTSNIKKNIFTLYDAFSFNKILGYLPVNEDITYTLNISKNYKLLYIEKNGEEIEINELQNEKQIALNFGQENNIEVKLILEKNSYMIQIIILILVLLIILGLFVLFRKQTFMLLEKRIN